MSRRLLVLNERDPRHPQAGGAEVHLREIFRRLAAGGDEVTLVASGFPGAPAEEDVDGLRVLRRGHTRAGYYARVPDRKSTRLNSSHQSTSRMPSSA